jgi:hypothetical protein
MGSYLDEKHSCTQFQTLAYNFRRPRPQVKELTPRDFGERLFPIESRLKNDEGICSHCELTPDFA